MLLETYLLEKAVSDLNHELPNRPDWVRVPLQLIQSILEQTEHRNQESVPATDAA
jgi:maltose alpha-D-glucosyltransferase/alpha-amylase